MTSLPLAMLVHDGPIARAYLLALAAAGVRPMAILRLVWLHSVVDRAPVGRWLPPPMRRWYAARSQEIALNYWSRTLAARRGALVQSVARAVADSLDWPTDYVETLTGAFDYRQYADTVIDVAVQDWRSAALDEALDRVGDVPIVFTGGGIVPSALTERHAFLHVHPGRLPQIRGADGLLWSTLLLKHPTVSCFVMRQGLDTGPLIAARDLPALVFPLDLDAGRPDDLTLYRALYAFYDPMCRASLLRDVAVRMREDGVRPIVSQAVNQLAVPGNTYHFMSERLRHEALQRLFVDATAVAAHG